MLDNVTAGFEEGFAPGLGGIFVAADVLQREVLVRWALWPGMEEAVGGGAGPKGI